jgi:hypothetical protein
MSHDSHDSHAAHHDTAEEVKKAVVLAILIIAGLATAIGVFIVRSGHVHAANERGATLPGGEPRVVQAEQIPTRSRPELVRGARNRDRVNPRVDYARYLNRRLRAKGRTCVVRSRGELARTLEISWTKDRLDSKHLEQLKTAQGFVDILRERGYDTLELKVDDKVVWRRKL